jgi:aryl-alcohol dehydrogenase-like predicted oxidoreductase
VSLQCRYNILDRAIEAEIIPCVRRFNIATMIYGPLNGGILSGRYHKGEQFEEGSRLAHMRSYQEKLTDAAWEVLERLEEIAGRHGIGMNKLAFAWLLSKPYVTTVLMGGSKPEHFEDLYGVDEIDIGPEDPERIDEISKAWRYGPFHNQRIVDGAPPALNRW